MPRLLSVNVGLPKEVGWQGRTVRTGIWKSPVTGPRMVRRLNVDGDGQGDLGGHGGEQRAVMVYQADSYAHWQRHFGRQDLEYGNFGENFTVDGLGDDEVCIGDRYRIGAAEFEVTQPRVTCYRVGMRLGEPTMPALLVAHHRPGFYLRVITEGPVEAGDEIVRTRIGPHAVSVADIDALLYLPGRDPARLRAALDIPALSPGWQQSFRELLDAADAGRRPDAPAAGTEPPGWAGFRRLRVTRRVAESATIASLYLEAEDGSRLPAPRAGQFLTVRVPGAGDPAPVRSYSLSSDPAGGVYRISVKRESHGSVSTYLNTRLAPGSELDVAAPRGDFVLADDDRPVLLISAGIGATPARRPACRERGLVDPHRPGAGAAGLRGRVAPARRRAAGRPGAHLLHRPGRAAHPGRPRRAEGAGELHRVHLRARDLHDRHARRADRARPRRESRALRTVRHAAADQPRPDRRGPPRSASAGRTGRDRAAGDVRPQWTVRPLARGLRIPAGPGGRLRRADPLVVPDGGLPHLRDAGAGRHGGLRAGAARAAGRG
jgi:MOSC domain-containing protein YiiM